MEGGPSYHVQGRQHMAPTDIGAYGQRPPEAIPKESHREDQVSEIQKPTILSPQEGSDGAKDHFGPFTAERVHYKDNVQNADLEASETPSPNGSVDCLTGPQGRILACLNCQSLQTVSRVQIQRPELAVQGDALWVEPRAEGILETNSFYGALHDQERDMVPPLLGRPTDNRSLQRGMPPEAPEGHRSSTETRVDYKHGKVQTRTSTSIRMARHSLQSEEIRSEEYRNTDSPVQLTDESDMGEEDVYKTHNHASPRPRKLARPSRPSTQNSPLPYQSIFEASQRSPSGYNPTHEQQIEIIDLDMDESPTHNPTLGDPRTHVHSPVRCITDGIRIQNRPEVIPGELRQINEELLHQRTGTPHNLDGNVDDPQEGPSYQNTVRQLNSNSSNQQSLISGLPTGRLDKNDLETGSTDELVHNSSPHPRKIQRDCRPIISEYSTINRVVSPYESIHSGDTTPRTQSPSRSVRDESQQQIRDLHISMSRPQSVCSGRSEDGLEQLGLCVPVSPTSACFEGFTQADTIKYQNRLTHHERGANKTLVCTTEITSYSVTNNTSQVTTTSRRNHAERDESFKHSRVEVLKAANNAQYPECDEQTIHLMSVPVMKSSEEDYQRKWKFFLEFVSGKGIDFKDINIDIVLRFFSFLFYTKGLKPSTVSHYRTALTQPLLAYFKIDLKVPAVHSMLRAMKIQRPHEPTPRPAWNLNKVLTHLESLNTNSESSLLKKTAFLLLLATGWRISELHACVRNQDFCRFTERNSVILQPHSSFLAKNGLRKRLGAKEIKTLQLDDGQISKICPVTSLKEYLHITKNVKDGCLFVNPKDKSSITIFQLTYRICSLIMDADPNTRARVHDIRKYAASCTLQQDMLVGDLTEDFNWSSPAVFYKFYFLQTDDPGRPVSLPVRD